LLSLVTLSSLMRLSLLKGAREGAPVSATK
jgi:hypothetical protein